MLFYWKFNCYTFQRATKAKIIGIKFIRLGRKKKHKYFDKINKKRHGLRIHR